MEAQIKALQTEQLIKEMLGFLELSTDEEESTDDALENNEIEDDDELEDDDEDSYESATCEQNDINDNELPHITKQKRPKSTIAMEMQDIDNPLPTWNTDETTPSAKRLLDPIWPQGYENAIKSKHASHKIICNTKLESNCRRGSNTYVKEVNRAIYGGCKGHPAHGSADYFQATQNYAIYGKDFLDFPENLKPLLVEESETDTETEIEIEIETEPVVESNNSSCVEESDNATGGYGDGLYPTPAVSVPESTIVSYPNASKQLVATNTSTAAYYQMCNGPQPTVRPPTGSTTVTGSTTYGMFLGNKLTYVAAGLPTAPLVYNQHSSTTTNFISNSLANAALAPPAILYTNPMLTTTTQQYLNTFFKDTQYMSSGTTQSTISTTAVYERLVYAQMLQQQIYHQTQQQAAAVAAMFQHKQHPRASGIGTGGGAIVTAGVTTGLHLCGRNAALLNQTSGEILAKNATGTLPSTNGTDELVTTTASTE